MTPAAALEAAELIDERPDERLDTVRLEPYLREHLAGAEGPLSVRQFGGGKAKLDYVGRPEGYLERQLSGWVRRWQAAQGGERAEEAERGMAPVLDWLGRNLPSSGGAALLHNDYRLDNCLLDTADPSHIAAVLDWDMCTQGDPLADLGYVLNYWVEPGDNPEWREIAAMPTWRDGFPSRADAIERYASRTGFDVAPIGSHQVFAAFKLAVIIQQIYIRYVRGQTQDRRFEFYWRRVLGLAAKARLLADL